MCNMAELNYTIYKLKPGFRRNILLALWRGINMCNYSP